MNCIHHYIIDSEQKGTCKHCGEVKQFEPAFVQDGFSEPSWMKMRDLFKEIKQEGFLRVIDG